jgi:hypothetical protein
LALTLRLTLLTALPLLTLIRPLAWLTARTVCLSTLGLIHPLLH